MHHDDYDSYIDLCETPSHPPLAYAAGRRVPQSRLGGWITLGCAFVALLSAAALVFAEKAA